MNNQDASFIIHLKNSGTQLTLGEKRTSIYLSFDFFVTGICVKKNIEENIEICCSNGCS